MFTRRFTTPFLSAIIYLVSVLTSCSEQESPNQENKPDDESQAIATIDHREMAAQGGGFILRITASGNWSATSDKEWCTLSRTAGSGQNSVSGYIEPNDGDRRTVTIRVEAGNAVATFSIVQQGKNTETPDQQLYAHRIEIPVLKGGSNNLFITHTTEYKGEKAITYSMEYDCNRKSTRWVAFTFDHETCQNNTKRTDAWNVDPMIPTDYQTRYENYTNSSYSRGHLCASSDRLYSAEANRQTFFMSNINPQIQDGFNGGIWQKIEEQVQTWGKVYQASDTLYVVKGGTIDDGNTIGNITNNIPVPRYFFMAIVSLHSGQYDAIGFWLEHKSYPQSASGKNYTLSIDALEEKTGIDFFHNLPDNIEDDIEASYETSEWSWR